MRVRVLVRLRVRLESLLILLWLIGVLRFVSSETTTVDVIHDLALSCAAVGFQYGINAAICVNLGMRAESCPKVIEQLRALPIGDKHIFEELINAGSFRCIVGVKPHSLPV